MECLSSSIFLVIYDGIKRHYAHVYSSIGVLKSAQDLIIFFFFIEMLECIGHLLNFIVTSNP